MKRAVLQSFDAGSYSATVLIAGSFTPLRTVKVARNIAGAELIAGRSLAIHFFDLSNPDDAVVVAVW